MTRLLVILALFSLPLTFLSCASIDARAISCWSDETPGIRYYMPEPYFLVTKNPGLEPVFRLSKKPQKIKVGAPVPFLLGEWTDGKFERSATVELKAPISDISLPSSVTTSSDGGATSISVKVETAVGAEGVLFLTADAHPPSGKRWQLVLPFKLSKLEDGTVEIELQEKGAEIPTNEIRIFKVDVIYLPNPNRIVAIESTGGIGGTSELELELEQGWKLKSFGSKTDSKTPETIGAFATLIEKTGGAALGVLGALDVSATDAKSAAATREPEAILYAIEYDGRGLIEKLRPVSFGPGAPVPGK